MNQSSGLDAADHWNAEYQAQGIPSSWKADASTVVRWGLCNLEFLRGPFHPSDLVLDIGCGRGRNSLAAADALGTQATGFDYSASAIDAARASLEAAPKALRDRVTFEERDVRAGLPARDGSCALAMDIFVYFHLLRSEDRSNYRSELRRVLGRDGVLLLSLATSSDGYYSTCPEEPGWEAFSQVPVVVDREAGVGNIMHTQASLIAELSDQFELRMLWEKHATGPMHGAQYDRVTLATMWQTRGERPS